MDGHFPLDQLAGIQGLYSNRPEPPEKNIEFYKIQHGKYPDSLPQLLKDDEFAPIYDRTRASRLGSKLPLFNYEKVGDKYVLFSSGPDGVPNTKDDLHPTLALDSSKVGLIRDK